MTPSTGSTPSWARCEVLLDPPEDHGAQNLPFLSVQLRHVASPAPALGLRLMEDHPGVALLKEDRRRKHSRAVAAGGASGSDDLISKCADRTEADYSGWTSD